MRAERQRGRDLLTAADAAGGQHRNRGDLLDDLGPQHDRADLAAVPTCLAALGDDDVDTRVGMLARLRRRTAQRRHLESRLVNVLDHLGRRGAERVGDHLHLRVLERHLDLGRGSRLGPTEQLQGVAVAVFDRHTMVGEDLLAEVEVLLRHHLAQRLGQLLRGQVGVHAFVFVRDHDVDAVGVIADVLVNPFQLDLQLLGREADRSEHAEPPGLADRYDDVAAVGEGEYRELDAEFVADRGVHYNSWELAELERVLV